MSVKLKIRILGDTKADLLRCLNHITAQVKADETSGDSDDATSDITWDLEGGGTEDDDYGFTVGNPHHYFHVADWKDDVALGDTSRNYGDWVGSNLEQVRYDHQNAVKAQDAEETERLYSILDADYTPAD